MVKGSNGESIGTGREINKYASEQSTQAALAFSLDAADGQIGDSFGIVPKKGLDGWQAELDYNHKMEEAKFIAWKANTDATSGK